MNTLNLLMVAEPSEVDGVRGWAGHLKGGAAVSALVRARFCCILAAMLFWRFSPRDGAYFAGGLARWSYGLLSFVFCEFWVCIRRFEIRCTGQIGKFTGQLQNHGFFLLPIQITQIFSNQLSQRSPALGSMV